MGRAQADELDPAGPALASARRSAVRDAPAAGVAWDEDITQRGHATSTTYPRRRYDDSDARDTFCRPGRPPVEVHEPAAGSVSMLRDLPVVVRDGTTLRANVVLPAGGGRFPVLMSAHPYGKDNLPARRGRGWRVSIQYRMLRQTERVRFRR
jgi:predicted acyl esterase